MGEKRRFHLHTIDILAAANQHVLDAVEDIDETFRIDAPDIAGAIPAIGKTIGGRFRIVPITLHHIGPENPDFADLARSGRAAVRAYHLHIADGRGEADAIGASLIILTAIVAGDGGGFGGAIPLPREKPLEGLPDPERQFRRGGGPAIGNAFDGGEIAAGEIRRFQKLPRHGGNAGGVGDPFLLDQFQRAFRIPFVHQNDLAPLGERDQKRGMTAGDMKERCWQQNGFLRRGGIVTRPAIATAQRHERRAEIDIENVGDGVAMGAERALGPPRGAGGIENRRIIFRIDRDIGQRKIGERGITGWRTDQIGKRGNIAALSGRGADRNQFRTVQFAAQR